MLMLLLSLELSFLLNEQEEILKILVLLVILIGSLLEWMLLLVLSVRLGFLFRGAGVWLLFCLG